jgi:transcriptional regulator with PAS, ATPase and Fis domain
VLWLSSGNQKINELACKPEPSGSGGEAKFSFERIVGSSAKITETIRKAKKIARLDDPVLIQGESGTGKELFTQAIHYASRPGGPLIALNCAAIPKTLIESELFGYEGGAFTGAERHGRRGKIELANGGTLFLDEIGDMPLELQPVLLRVLEEKQVMRVGGSQYIPVDFRLIAATNKNLADLVQKEQFRADLYFRLAVYTLKIPSLRERPADIKDLTRHFLLEAAQKQQTPPPALSNAAKMMLYQYDWPGNVRQLKNTLMYALNMSGGGVIKPQDLPDVIREFAKAGDHGKDEATLIGQNGELAGLSNQSLTEVERDFIQEVLMQNGYCVSRAAKALGMSRSTLYKKIKGYSLCHKKRGKNF